MNLFCREHFPDLQYAYVYICLCIKVYHSQVKTFVEEIPPPGIYGQQQHTLLSLVMTHIRRTTDPESKTVIDTVLVSPSGEPVITTLAKYLQFQNQKSEVSRHTKCNFSSNSVRLL